MCPLLKRDVKNALQGLFQTIVGLDGRNGGPLHKQVILDFVVYDVGLGTFWDKHTAGKEGLVGVLDTLELAPHNAVSNGIRHVEFTQMI